MLGKEGKDTEVDAEKGKDHKEGSICDIFVEHLSNYEFCGSWRTNGGIENLSVTF